jgi:hypothetical protein
VQLKDILIDELIHREGWIQRDINANRYKIETKIRRDRDKKYNGAVEKVLISPNGENLSALKNIMDDGEFIPDEVEITLLKNNLSKYEHIYTHIEKLTKDFSEDEIISHHATAELLLDIGLFIKKCS